MIEKSLEASILFGILDLSSQIRLRGDLIYKFAGITTQQYVIILHLANDPNIPFLGAHKKEMLASELADSLRTSRPSITNILKALIKKGLVKQFEDENDRRLKRLRLTEQGERLVREIEPLRKSVNEEFFTLFNTEEKHTFLEYIRRCSEYAKEQLDNPVALEEMHERIYCG